MFWVVMFVLVVSGLLACLFCRLVDWFVGWLVGWLVLLLLLLLLWLSLWCLALWMCFFWAALCETFCVHHPRICWRAGCSQHHTTDMSLNITIDFSNHQSPKTNIDNADATTVTSSFLQSNSSPIPGRFWKTMFLFNARDMIFRPLLEGDFPPTYPDLPPATRGIMLTYFMLLFNKLFAVSGLNKVTKIFIVAEMFAVQKQKAGALTYETSIFKQYPKIYVYLIPFDCVSDHYNSTWSISPTHSDKVQATETHTHNQRVYVQ